MSGATHFKIYYILDGPEGIGSRYFQSTIVTLTRPEERTWGAVMRWLFHIFDLDHVVYDLKLSCFVSPTQHGTCWELIQLVGTKSWQSYVHVAREKRWNLTLLVQTYNKTIPASAAEQEGSGDTEKEVGESSHNAAHTVAEGGGVSLHPGRPESGVQQPSPNLENDSDNGSWPNCKHDKPCTIETSWHHEDPGRRFYRCPLFAESSKDCGFTQWLDKKFPEKATEHINYLLGSVDSLEQQVDNLQNELDELRRRHRKKSTKEAVGPGNKCRCDKIPCDCACRNRDDQPRPRQIRRLSRDN